MSVFVIISEWTANNNSTGAEVVEAKYYATEGEAWLALREVAEDYEVDLPSDEFSLSFEDPYPHLQFEEYYIQELIKSE